MTGHGDEGRPQFFLPHRHTAGGLGCIHNEGNPPAAAQNGDLLYGQDETEHIGDVGTHHRFRIRFQTGLKGIQQSLPVKQRGFGCHDLRPQGVERPGDGIVLPGGDEHPVPRLHQGTDGDVQAVGGVEGKHHLLGAFHAEEIGRRLTAGKGGLRRPSGGQMAAPAGAGQISHRPGRRPGHSGGLLQGGGGAVQIDHSPTSR